MTEVTLHDVLRRFARTMAHPYDVTDALYELCDHIVDVLDATGAGVSVADADGALRFVTATSDDVVALEQIQEELQTGPCVLAYATGTVTVINDLDALDDWDEYKAVTREVNMNAALGVPLMVGEHRLGAVNVYNRTPREWTTTDVETASVLADIAAAYFINARQLQETRELAEQLQHALESRVIIEQAKGKLAGGRDISMDQAFEILRRHARMKRAKLADVADAVVNLGLDPK